MLLMLMNMVVRTNMDVKFTVITALKLNNYYKIKAAQTDFEEKRFEVVGRISNDVEQDRWEEDCQESAK